MSAKISFDDSRDMNQLSENNSSSQSQQVEIHRADEFDNEAKFNSHKDTANQQLLGDQITLESVEKILNSTSGQ